VRKPARVQPQALPASELVRLNFPHTFPSPFYMMNFVNYYFSGTSYVRDSYESR
jgi:hypothetical protein